MKNLQEIFAAEPQSAMEFARPAQDGIPFPLTLAERYQPRRIDNFVGLARPKALLTKLLAKPRPCSMLFVGPPGAGKTSIAMAFAEQLGGSLKHLPAQKIDVASLETLRDELAYAPTGGWWVVLGDEADQMTEKAQTQLLSRLDGTACLKPKFGGGFERGIPAPIIWIWTLNGRGPKETEPPSTLLPRFQSRNMLVEFDAPTVGDLATFLQKIWQAENGPDTPAGYFEHMARAAGIRDALMRLEVDLLTGPRNLPSPEPLEAAQKHVSCPSRHHPRHRAGLDLASIRSRAAEKAWETRRANMRIRKG